LIIFKLDLVKRSVIIAATASLFALSSGVPLAKSAKTQGAKPHSPSSPTPTPSPSPEPTGTPAPDSEQDYLSTLNPTYTPAEITWSARRWRVNAGSRYFPNMDHSIRISPYGKKVRFEIRNTIYDNTSGSGTNLRRSELSGSIYGDPRREWGWRCVSPISS